MIDDILKDIAKNMKVFKEIKQGQMKDNTKQFLVLYWLIAETSNAACPDIPEILPEHKTQANFLLELGYKAGYMDALK